MMQTRTNVPLGLTRQQLLLQAQLRLRITMKHVYSHGQNVGSECADHAAALGALGFISNQNMNTRWARPPFGSATLLCACGNMYVIFFVLREKDAHACPTGAFRKLVKCPVLCFSEHPCVPPGPRCSIMLCVWLSRHARARFIFQFLIGRSWVTMDFSGTSSDELEEHKAWNPM